MVIYVRRGFRYRPNRGQLSYWRNTSGYEYDSEDPLTSQLFLLTPRRQKADRL